MSTGTIDRVETDRMVLERLQPEHGAELRRLLLDPRVGATLWPPSGPPSETDMSAALAAKVSHWERFGFGMWLLRDRRTGEMVGRGGLQHTYTAGLNSVEVGWAIVPERWGEGLATELAHASVETGFDRLDLFEIVAFTLPHNLASRRVMEKAGFEFDCDIIHAGMPHVLYLRRRDGA